MIKLSGITFLKTISILLLLSIILIIPVSAQNNSAWTIDSSVLNTLPFRGENNLYYILFPGVTSQDFRGNDYLHIRGSRHDELAYYINGIDFRSDYTGLPLFRIIPQALDNITIDKAPSVRTSSARAVIAHEIKQSGEKPSFSLYSETDKFTPLYEQRLGTYSYGYKNLTLTGGGTIPKIGTDIFIAGEKESFTDHYRMFWDGFHLQEPDFNITFIDPSDYSEISGIDELLVKPGNIPSANLGRTTLNGILTQPISNGSISFVALYENETRRINNTPIFHMFNQKRLSETNRKAQLYSLQGEYNFPMDFKLNLQADFMRSNESTYDPNFGDDFWKYSDSTALVQAGIPYATGASYIQLHYFNFHKQGREITGYSKKNENSNNFKFELSKSINNHAIKLGGNYKISEYRFFSMGTYTMRSLQHYMRFKSWATIRDIPPNELEQFLFRNRVQGVGYNLLGEKIEKENQYYDSPITPKKVSFYISDVISKGDWTTEFGLRYDSIDTDMLYHKDSTLIGEYYYWTNLQEYNSRLSKQAQKTSWSPRIKIEYRTNDRLTSYLKLGKYIQYPQYTNIFMDKRYRALYGYGSGSSNNNPRAWDAEYTTSYQSSYELNYLLNSKTNINIELYNISNNNYLQTGKKGLIYTIYENFPEYIEYSTLLSNGSTISRGIELNLNYRDTNLEAWINYNYSNVKGTSSYPISNYPFTNTDNWWLNDSTDYIPPQNNIDFNNQHSAVGFFAYKYGEEENVLLKNVTISMLGRFDSGHPYTLWEAGWGAGVLYEGGLPSHSRMRILHDPAYGYTTPWRITLDIKIDKTIKFGKYGKLTFYAYTQNILNKKNINHVHWKTGNTVDDGAEKMFNDWNLPETAQWDYESFIELYRIVNIGHRQHYRANEGGDLFGRPREIRFGISFSY